MKRITLLILGTILSYPAFGREISGTVFCSGVPGFSVLTGTKKDLKLSLIDKNGNVVYQVTRSK